MDDSEHKRGPGIASVPCITHGMAIMGMNPRMLRATPLIIFSVFSRRRSPKCNRGFFRPVMSSLYPLAWAGANRFA